MVSTLNMVFLILSFEAFNSPLVFSSSVFSRMFSRLIVDVESLTSSREISKSDLGWCKQTEEHSFVSPNRFLLLFHAINFGGVRFVRISSFASVIKRFVWRENPERELKLKKKKFLLFQFESQLAAKWRSGEEDSMFVAETASLLDFFSGIKQRRHRSLQIISWFQCKLWHPYRNDSSKQTRKLPSL